MQCPECGYHKMDEQIRDETLYYSGKHRKVTSLKGEFCPICDEGVWDSESNKRLDMEQMELIDEVRRATNKEDDSEMKNFFSRLHDEAMWLLSHWALYEQLFNRSKSRYDLVYTCSKTGAHLIRDALENEILMSLSRLTDEPGSGDQENLSFQQFHVSLEKKGKEELAEKLRGKIKIIRKELVLIREHRNNRLAHLNKGIAMKETRAPKRLSTEHLKKAITALKEYLIEFQQYYKPDTTFSYETPIHNAGDELLSVLKDGLRLRELADEEKVSRVELREGKWKDVLRESHETDFRATDKIVP